MRFTALPWLAILAWADEGGAPLEEPSVLESRDGVLNVTLTLGVARWHAPRGISLLTRAWACDYTDAGTSAADQLARGAVIPAPTLRARPGDVVHVTLVNTLGPNAPFPGSTAPLSTLRAANSSNLHLHGSFAPPRDDDTFVIVDPGESHTWTWRVPADDTGSLLWYHPHMDGSSAVQLVGGLAGAFATDAGEGRGKGPLADYCSRVLVLQSLNFAPDAGKGGTVLLLAAGGASGLHLGLNNPRGVAEVMLLVNGKLAPALRVPADKAGARLRLVNAIAASQGLLALGLRSSDDEGADAADACTLDVLALDGVWLTAPRRVASPASHPQYI